MDVRLEIRELPDGTGIPDGVGAELMLLFDLAGILGSKPRWISWLREQLTVAVKRPLQSSELEHHLDALQKSGLLEEYPPAKPKKPPLPGVVMPRLPTEPVPGERLFAATERGKAVARAILARKNPLFAPWLLGDSRLGDTILVALDWVHTRDDLKAVLPVVPSERLEAALVDLMAAGLVREDDGRVARTTAGNGICAAARDDWMKVYQSFVQADGRLPFAVGVRGVRDQLTFLNDSNLTRIIERDLDELGRALTGGLAKASLIICGSVLEGILFDVLDRNRPVAQTYVPKNMWPDRASLPVLIEAASGQGLLSEESARRATRVTQHRDLVHPWAEIRDQLDVDEATVTEMVGLLRAVVRDLSRAGDAIAKYEQK